MTIMQVQVSKDLTGYIERKAKQLGMSSAEACAAELLSSYQELEEMLRLQEQQAPPLEFTEEEIEELSQIQKDVRVGKMKTYTKEEVFEQLSKRSYE